LESMTLSTIQIIDLITKTTAYIIFGFIFKMFIKKEEIPWHLIIAGLWLGNTINILTFFGMIVQK